MATVSTDIFGKQLQEIKQPFTADRAIIMINNNVVGGAMNINIGYTQGITKRRVIGGRSAIIYASQPNGQISISRLVTFTTIPGAPESGFPNFGTGLWTVCNPADVKFEMTGGTCGDATYSLTATGCVITQFTMSAEAEGLTIADGVTIDFLQLLATNSTPNA